jgi:hypothetical protein
MRPIAELLGRPVGRPVGRIEAAPAGPPADPNHRRPTIERNLRRGTAAAQHELAREPHPPDQEHSTRCPAREPVRSRGRGRHSAQPPRDVVAMGRSRATRLVHRRQVVGGRARRALAPADASRIRPRRIGTRSRTTCRIGGFAGVDRLQFTPAGSDDDPKGVPIGSTSLPDERSHDVRSRQSAALAPGGLEHGLKRVVHGRGEHELPLAARHPMSISRMIHE